MVSFDLSDGDRGALFRFVDGLRLVLPATSLGDIYTLVSVPIMSSHRDLTPEQRADRGISDGMLRLSIGIEDAGDIIEDLKGALAAAQSTL
jgi:cystathionine gamma-synthase